VSRPVGESGEDEGEDEGGGPGRDRVQLRLDGAVVVGRDDERGEEGVAVGRNDHAEVHEPAQPDPMVFHHRHHVPERDLALRPVVPLVRPQTRLDECALLFVEPLSFLWTTDKLLSVKQSSPNKSKFRLVRKAK